MFIRKIVLCFLVCGFTMQAQARTPVKLYHTAEGMAVETENAIVLKGVRVVQDGAQQAAIEINNPDRKRIIVNNVEVITRNGQYTNNEGRAAVISVHSGKYDNTELNNVRVNAYGNTRIHAQGERLKGINSTCAALICHQSNAIQRGTFNVKTKTVGNFDAKAEQR